MAEIPWPPEARKAVARALCGPEEPMKTVRRFVGDTFTEMTLLASYEDDAAAALAALTPFVAQMLAAAREEGRIAGLREAVGMIGCGCAQAAEIVKLPPNSARRWELCGQPNCCAIEAAAILARAEGKP